MITFTIADLDQALKDRNPAWADSASFAARRTAAAKQALGIYYDNLRSTNDLWARSSTLGGSAVSTGTQVVDTTVSDVYHVTLPTGQLGVADNTIFVQQSTGTFLEVPRMSIDSIVLGVSATTIAFWENNGEIILYDKDGQFTAPGNLHYNFWRNPAIDCSLSTNTVDIRPQDFTSFVDSVLSYLSGS